MLTIKNIKKNFWIVLLGLAIVLILPKSALTQAPSYPDLTTSAPIFNTPVVTNTPINFTSTISNIGPVSTGAPFYNSFQVATGPSGAGAITPLIASNPSPMSTLAAGASAAATASYTFLGSTRVGMNSVRFCADEDTSMIGSINEGAASSPAENNNCSAWTNVDVASGAVTVSASPLSAGIIKPTGTNTASVVFNVAPICLGTYSPSTVQIQTVSSTLPAGTYSVTASPIDSIMAQGGNNDMAAITCTASGFYGAAHMTVTLNSSVPVGVYNMQFQASKITYYATGDPDAPTGEQFSGISSISQPVTLYVNNTNFPMPDAVQVVSPAYAVAGGTGFTLTVGGLNFVPGSQVLWNDVAKPTTYVSATRLTATIPASDITTYGSRAITVLNPTPGGGQSDPPAGFLVKNPAPVLSYIVSNGVNNSCPQSTSGCLATFKGTGFSDTVGYYWTGPVSGSQSAGPTGSGSSNPFSGTSFNTTIGNSITSNVGVYSFYVQNSDGQNSNIVPFTVGGGGITQSVWTIYLKSNPSNILKTSTLTGANAMDNYAPTGLAVSNDYQAKLVITDSNGNTSIATKDFSIVSSGTAGVCGTANGKVYPNGSSSYGSDTQCSPGTSSNITFPTAGNTVTWVCHSTNGGADSPTCSASQAVAVQTYSITVNKTVGGSVTSNVGGINCGSTCVKSYNKDTVVTLQAVPDSIYWKFVGWTGDCSGTGNCVVTVSTSKNVSAIFVPAPFQYQEF